MSELEEQKMKNEIIRDLLLKYKGSVSGYEQYRRELWTSTRDQLQRIVAIGEAETLAQTQAIAARQQQQTNQINAERLWDHFFFKHPDIRDSTANRNIIGNYALSLSDDEFVTEQHLEEASSLPGLDRQRVRQQPTTANLAQDEETLQKYCRVNRLEMSTAALSLLRQQFGTGFDVAQITEALRTHAISLGPATQEQLREWASEAQEEYQEFLVNKATPLELREIANKESEQRHVQVQRQKQESQVKFREQMEAGQHPVLPEFAIDGVKLDSVFFRKLADTNIKLFKQYCNKYGFAAVTARLNQVS